MKTLIAARIFFKSVKLRFKRDWAKRMNVNKYGGLASDIMSDYCAKHPKATHRMATRHVERELKKLMKKDKELKSQN